MVFILGIAPFELIVKSIFLISFFICKESYKVNLMKPLRHFSVHKPFDHKLNFKEIQHVTAICLD